MRRTRGSFGLRSSISRNRAGGVDLGGVGTKAIEYTHVSPNCYFHQNLNPESAAFLDSRLRGNDGRGGMGGFYTRLTWRIQFILQLSGRGVIFSQREGNIMSSLVLREFLYQL